MNGQKKSWFRIRKLGWTPCSWMGWAVLAAYIALMMYTLDIADTTTRRLCGGSLTACTILLAMWKTEPRSAKK